MDDRQSMAETNEAAEGIARLRRVWGADPVVGRRIDADVAAFARYIEARRKHVALSRATADDYDAAAVRAADSARTGAHDAAIAAAADLNALAGLAGIGPVAPVPVPGADPTGPAHRNAIARYIADALGLGADERTALALS